MNVTNSDEIDRATILPDYVKDLNNIPIMKLYSKFLPTESERDSQFVVGLDQYLFIGHFAAPVSVEETDFNNNLTMEILPNPVNEFASLKIYNDGNPINGVIAIYDLLGNKILSNEIGILNSGTSFHNIKTNSMVSGTYLCTISAGDRKITGMLNVLK